MSGSVKTPVKSDQLGFLVRVLCLPDVERVIGGVKQLYRHVEHLVSIGLDAAVVTQNPGFRPSWFESSAPSLSLHECLARGEFNRHSCILVVPETYLSVNWTQCWGVDLSSLPRVVFNQNAYYSLESSGDSQASLLADFYDHPSVLQVFSISEDSHRFLSHNLAISDLRLSRIINAIEPIFCRDSDKANRIHWMPRKNPDHVNAVLGSARRSGLPFGDGWLGEPLESMTHREVADKLTTARLFLSFGHPEGFGLPIAEAMAAGCWVVGYSGGGGNELFRFGASCQVEFGDWGGFLAGIKAALQEFAIRPRETELRLQRQALAVSTLYSYDQERASIEAAWKRVADAYASWKLSCSN